MLLLRFLLERKLEDGLKDELGACVVVAFVVEEESLMLFLNGE